MKRTNAKSTRRVPKSDKKSVCPNCDHDSVTMSIRSDIYRYGSVDSIIELPIKIPVYKCESCGFQFTDWKAEQIKQDALCRYFGVLTPKQILSIRKRLRMSRKRFAKVTGLGEDSLSRWEKGINIQNLAMDRYLRLLEDPDNVRQLLNLVSKNDSPSNENERDQQQAAQTVQD